MTDPEKAAKLLLVGPVDFQESAATLISAHCDIQLRIRGRRSLSDLDDWDHDLVVFRLSAQHPAGLENMLSFLAQENRADAVAVVIEGEEDLGVGAVVRGALNFILDDPAEYPQIGRLLAQARRRRLQPPPNMNSVVQSFESEGAFTTVCHPIMELESMEAVGWEFLSRGPHGPLNLPARFFRWGREHDRLTEFDLLCLRSCLKSAQSSSCEGRFHFNLFPQTLGTAEIAPLLEDMAQVREQKICLEISETALPGVITDLVRHRARLKELGIELAIDDIGFQARGLGLVHELRPDVLKIDRRVTNNIRKHESKRRIVASTLNLAESLGAIVIAEGVELQSELGILQDLGVSYAQGFFWGKPTLPDQAAKSLRSGGGNQEQS